MMQLDSDKFIMSFIVFWWKTKQQCNNAGTLKANLINLFINDIGTFLIISGCGGEGCLVIFKLAGVTLLPCQVRSCHQVFHPEEKTKRQLIVNSWVKVSRFMWIYLLTLHQKSLTEGRITFHSNTHKHTCSWTLYRHTLWMGGLFSLHRIRVSLQVLDPFFCRCCW